MATLTPFRALRPKADAASRIAAVPYDVVNTDEARALADGNALSFLRVSRAELELSPDANPYDASVYERAAQNFKKLRDSRSSPACSTSARRTTPTSAPSASTAGTPNSG